jgi:hypothetical protein
MVKNTILRKMSNILHSDVITLTMSPKQLNEAISKGHGKFVVQAIVQRANLKNANKRYYSKPVLEREIGKYMEGPVKDKRAYGELDHSEETIVNLRNACINIMELWWEEDDVWAIMEVLNTPSGKIVQELLKAGLGVGISSRGTGSVTQIDEESVEVNDDFELVCWDIVSNPSTPGAFLHLNEGVESKELSFGKINEIIGDILCQNIGFCSCELKK